MTLDERIAYAERRLDEEIRNNAPETSIAYWQGRRDEARCMMSDLIQQARELCAKYRKSGWNIPFAFIELTESLADALEVALTRIGDNEQFERAKMTCWLNPVEYCACYQEIEKLTARAEAAEAALSEKGAT